MQVNVKEKTSQAQKAYYAIEEMIVSLKLKPGTKLSEKSLCQMLGMGRTPVREALLRLSTEGTVLVSPRSGITISQIDIKDQFRVLEIMRPLERILVERSAVFATSEERDCFAELADQFQRAADSEDESLFLAADREFNQLLAVSAHNRHAVLISTFLHTHSRRFLYLYFKQFGDLRQICSLHANIALAIARQDRAGAKSSSDALIDYSEAFATIVAKMVS